MSGIFRAAFHTPQRVQSSLGTLSGATAAGGAILPAHVPAANAFFVTSSRRSVSATLFGAGPAFATAVVRVTLKPILIGSSSVYFDAAVDAGAGVVAGLFVNGSSFAAPLLTLRLLPVALESTANAYAPGTGQAGAKSAPLVASGSAAYAPRVEGGYTVEVVGTLNVAGWVPGPANRRPRAPKWPNLPQVEAPPWRLTVVTPEVARARARSLIAQRRRTERARRTREARRVLDGHLDEIVEAEIAHTVVRLVGQEA
jgi:hypothetical protein